MKYANIHKAGKNMAQIWMGSGLPVIEEGDAPVGSELYTRAQL